MKPLTALAWERLGFKSLVFIIGTRHKWMGHPVLSYILTNLEEMKSVTIFFIESPLNHQAMISQNIRFVIFIAIKFGFVFNFKSKMFVF